MIAVPLPDGRWLALTREEFAAALARGAEMMGPAQPAVIGGPIEPERLVDSRGLAALLGVHDTTVEALAARGEIPSHRFGKALRFAPSDVLAAKRQQR